MTTLASFVRELFQADYVERELNSRGKIEIVAGSRRRTWSSTRILAKSRPR